MLHARPEHALSPTGQTGTGRPQASTRLVAILALVVGAAVTAASASHRAVPVVQSNPNTARAGVLRNGVLSVILEAKEGLLHLNGPSRPAMTIEAFAEPGKAPLMPGPLLRAPAGTEIQLTIRNSLRVPLTFFIQTSIHDSSAVANAWDSVVVAPGAAGTLRARAELAGNYVYRATTTNAVNRVNRIAGLLGGAIVVDTTGAPARPSDRILVVMATEDSASVACDDTTHGNTIAECTPRRFVYTINGAAWPNTERLHATVGDSLHWRVINVSNQVHPMHLHGFYYRVDAITGRASLGEGRHPAPGQLVVTQLLGGFGTMSMTWSPHRPGNWLFHCHFAVHNTPDSLDASADDPQMRDMTGLVIGTIVAPRAGVVAAGAPVAARRLRLIAVPVPMRESRGRDVIPTMHFLLEDHGTSVDTHSDWSPELDLVRGEPVAITIVNHLDEPTAVHWHGIEVEDSYMDGAAGFSGEGKHLTPAIAPGDSFIARFTPPRSGTFMYHSHLDELRQELAGMEGALVVRDANTPPPADDHVFFLKGGGRGGHPPEIDGQVNPDTVVLHAGRTARLRLINLGRAVPQSTALFWLTARSDSPRNIGTDSMLVQWRPVAKDAFDLPEGARVPRVAEQLVSFGETYDFEYTPEHRGAMLLEVRASGPAHALFVRVPIRVE